MIPGMKSAKQQVLDALERLPDDATTDTVLAEIHVKAAVLRGLDDARAGRVVDHEEVKSRLDKWLASSGQMRLSST